jgi:hypothetical protein
MNEKNHASPQEAQIIAERCVEHVRNRHEVELDYTSNTLSVIDFFIRDVVAEECGGTAPPPGDSRRAHLVHLLGSTVGVYFGELLCRTFPCRWRISGEEPENWLIEFDHVPLRFNPTIASVEAFTEQEAAGLGQVLITEPMEVETLIERLSVAPPVPADEFFSLTTRFEVLQIAVEWLREHIAGRDDPPPAYYSPQEYDRIFKV